MVLDDTLYAIEVRSLEHAAAFHLAVNVAELLEVIEATAAGCSSLRVSAVAPAVLAEMQLTAPHRVVLPLGVQLDESHGTAPVSKPPDMWRAAEWIAHLHDRGIGQREALQELRAFAEARALPVPGSLDAVAGRPELVRFLLEYRPAVARG